MSNAQEKCQIFPSMCVSSCIIHSFELVCILKGKFSITKATCNLLIATEVSEYQMTPILTFFGFQSNYTVF